MFGEAEFGINLELIFWCTSVKYMRQTLFKITQCNSALCLYFGESGNPIRKPSGPLAFYSARKWRNSSVPHLGWFSSVCPQKVPDHPPPTPSSGQGLGGPLCPTPRHFRRPSHGSLVTCHLAGLSCRQWGLRDCQALVSGLPRRGQNRGAWKLGLRWQVVYPV